MRKTTPGEFRAVGPTASTDPAPPDSDLQAQIAELMGALENVGTLAAELVLNLKQIRLAQLASEGAINTHRAKRIADRRLLGDHERRVREVEAFLPLLAELEKERGTAAE